MKNLVKIWTLAFLAAFATTACNTGNQAASDSTANATIDSLKLTLEILKVQQAMAAVNASDQFAAGKTGSYEALNSGQSNPGAGQAVNGMPPPQAYYGGRSANDRNYTDYDRRPTAPVVNTSERIEQSKKKKMNEVTKGVLIGAGVGAVGGAIVAKKKVKGAVIGGVLGAVGGGVAGKVIKNRRERERTDVAFERLLTSY